MEDAAGYSSSTLIIVLALATLGIALAFGIYQRFAVEKSKKTNEHSSLTQDPRLQQDSPVAQDARRRS